MVPRGAADDKMTQIQLQPQIQIQIQIQPPREPDIGPRELVDDREHFHEMCVSRHWQSDELYRAHWSTMMLLAVLGGPPD